MPDFMMGVIPDDPRRVQKVHLKVSKEFKDKGHDHIKQSGKDFSLTDEQIIFSEVVSTPILPSLKAIPTPPVGYQGGEGSCVSFAIGYYYRSIEQYIKSGAVSYSYATNILSPEYLFNYVQLNGCNGSTLLDNLELMMNKGICLWQTLPYTSGSCDVATASPHDAEAANFRITSYAMLLLTDRSLIKGSLANNKPVYININVDSAFYSANSAFIWNATNHAGSPLIGQHAVLIVGYDDSKNAYKIVNQWGTGWGDAGYSWIDYDFLETGGQCGGYGMTIEAPASTNPVSPLPVPDAGSDVTIPETSTAQLSATASYDADGYIASYLWDQIAGSPVVINNPTAAVANVSSWAGAGLYTFRVVVTDNDGNTASDTVNVNITSAQVLTVTATKSSKKGKFSDTVVWNISLPQPFIAAEIQVGSSLSAMGLLTKIYTPTGQYTYLINAKKTRYYQLKVTKADGTVIYSDPFTRS